ncbi:MAG: MATE family efflux transporter [Lachnospiraceae bacterium]|nr:MATE family efflux transporter [Lachnospiraceae bacterium]
MENSITQGNLVKAMMRFSIPYLISSFLQTFYGMADLFITGQFNGAAEVTAVSIGSQIMHMFTVIAVGLAMGTTVSISRSVGAGDRKKTSLAIGNSITVFIIFAVLSTAILLLNITNLLQLLQTPEEASASAGQYLLICFIGIIFIVAYNVISSIYRGLGDTRSPMIFVGIAGVFNIGLDYLLIGPLDMGAAGAGIATVIAQAASVVLALIFSRRIMKGKAALSRQDLRLQSETVRNLLSVGLPIAAQDGFIQVSFLIITMIANMRGLAVAAAVGVVEKVISFLFLVPSAMLSTISALAAQNAGAGLHERGRRVLRYGLAICVGYGTVVFLVCQAVAPAVVSLFAANEPEVIVLGGQYLRAYSVDCIFAGIHFCFSGYFSAYGKSIYSFIHNLISVLAVRIPGSYLASILFTANLFPMGLAAPLGSCLSAVICIFLYRRLKKSQSAAGTK